jgi:hypothetical protein
MKSRLIALVFCAAMIVGGAAATSGEFPWQIGWLF